MLWIPSRGVFFLEATYGPEPANQFCISQLRDTKMAEVIDNIGSEAGYVYLEGLRVGVTFETKRDALIYHMQHFSAADLSHKRCISADSPT
ncbi:hypothetical protein PC116_g24076 [Phytophthora cactorum]|uniref:Uncharacterized protein n=1 Tax=Phytophthora cactorum TaxID=29920 RepID=A0A8T0YI21_9STRA|nr:hypothetical protein PC113_g19932 [Phytophthora cactorum]KAG4227537.1 hypothetical protein PC116_g24076 [Phytophthora cactorum]